MFDLLDFVSWNHIHLELVEHGPISSKSKLAIFVSVVFGPGSNIVRSLIFEFFSFKTRPKNELRVRGGNIKSQINAKHLTIV